MAYSAIAEPAGQGRARVCSRQPNKTAAACYSPLKTRLRDITTIPWLLHRTLRRHALEAPGTDWRVDSDANHWIEQKPPRLLQHSLPLPAHCWPRQAQGLGLNQLRQRLSKLEDNPALALPALAGQASWPISRLGDQLHAY